MGSVWLADHLALQSQVAVKFMASSMLDDQVSISRFQQEAKAAAEIRSPHVAQVFDYGTCHEPGGEKQVYIVMELLDGASLDKHLRANGVLTPAECATVIGQCCKALANAHRRGIAHRDVKPANIFLIDSGGDLFVKVLDFGVAKFMGEEAINMTAAGNMVGTPAFMSPEQLFHGKDSEHHGDLWSVAVVAYFALVGERPFKGKTLGELCVSIKTGVFTMPSELRHDLSPDIDAFFARAFHADIEQRFQTAKEIAQEFERGCGIATQMSSTPSSVAVQALHTFPGTAVSQATMSRPKSRRVVLGLAAAACMGLGGAVAAFVAMRSDASATDGPAPAVTATARAEVGPSNVEQSPSPPADTAKQEDAEEEPEAAGDDIDEEVEAATGDDASAAPNPVAPPPVQPPPKAPATPAPPPKGEDERSKRAAEEFGI